MPNGRDGNLSPVGRHRAIASSSLEVVGSQRLTVLLVESSQLVLEAIADMLSELDAISVVGTTTNLSAALALAERERPDLVLVDAWTGDVGVTALVGQFRTRSPSSAVAITASHCDADIATRAAQ